MAINFGDEDCGELGETGHSGAPRSVDPGRIRRGVSADEM